jgi:hypothetical protein
LRNIADNIDLTHLHQESSPENATAPTQVVQRMNDVIVELQRQETGSSINIENETMRPVGSVP